MLKTLQVDIVDTSVQNRSTEVPRVLLIDNYDSFTYNIVQYLMCLGINPLVITNDQMSVEEILKISFSHLILSPGPGNPSNAGVCKNLIHRLMQSQIAVLGVCLGHQIIAEVFGANVQHALQIHHGKVSLIENSGLGIFSGLPAKYKVTRYHSLIVANPLPDCLSISAWHLREDGQKEIMALQHKNLPIFGVQFHPEAILTENGLELLKNFLFPEGV
jgi:anthranilate synthase/aminodeoxychorismate synthase-like glutamine amidotransferase